MAKIRPPANAQSMSTADMRKLLIVAAHRGFYEAQQAIVKEKVRAYRATLNPEQLAIDNEKYPPNALDLVVPVEAVRDNQYEVI